LALLLKAKVAGGLWTLGDWQSAAGGREGTLRASLRSGALSRVEEASTSGITTRGRRGDRSSVSGAFRRLSSDVVGS
jgi:hypothetical protein